MGLIEQLFDRMDAWRHFPNYQLERRADLFFSLYLQQVLCRKTGLEINGHFAPEFPVRIGTIYPEIPTDKSYKIDYVAVSENGTKAFLIELKTEGESRRESQDKYLVAAQKAGMTALLDGLVHIFRATQAKHKYYCLLAQLELMGLLGIPDELRTLMQQPSLKGVGEVSRKISITSKVARCEILYIQPEGQGKHVISFAECADAIEKNSDPFAARFSQSLREWARVKAGQRGPDGSR